MILRSLAILLGLAAAATAASAQTVINSVPYAITTSGKYVLGNNFITASANQSAITISAPNVVLDLNKFFVSGPGNSTSSRVAVISVGNVSNVTIYNGTVANNGLGIAFADGANSINHLVENVNVTRCLLAGIYFVGNSASTIVRNNTISQIQGYIGGNDEATGIYCLSGVRVENNFIYTVDGGNGAPFGGPSTGINASSASFVIGNTISFCAFGIKGGICKDNLTTGCTTKFSNIFDAGGNF